MEARYGSGWRKAARSTANGACIEVSGRATRVYVRDSKNVEGPVLGFPGESWRSFVTRTKIKDLSKVAPLLTSKDASDAA